MQNVSFCRWEKCLFLTCFFIDDDETSWTGDVDPWSF